MFERCIYFNTNSLVRKLNDHWEKAFQRFSLSPSHGYLLRLVLEKPGLSQQEIASELRLEKSTVARFLNDLERRKLVKRRQSPSDPRRNTIDPTNEATAIRDKLEELGDELYSDMCKAIGEKNVRAFVTNAREFAEKI